MNHKIVAVALVYIAYIVVSIGLFFATGLAFGSTIVEALSLLATLLAIGTLLFVLGLRKLLRSQ